MTIVTYHVHVDRKNFYNDSIHGMDKGFISLCNPYASLRTDPSLHCVFRDGKVEQWGYYAYQKKSESQKLEQLLLF